MTQITDKIEERIEARMQKILKEDKIDKQNLDLLLKLYQLKSWVAN